MDNLEFETVKNVDIEGRQNAEKIRDPLTILFTKCERDSGYSHTFMDDEKESHARAFAQNFKA